MSYKGMKLTFLTEKENIIILDEQGYGCFDKDNYILSGFTANNSFGKEIKKLTIDISDYKKEFESQMQILKKEYSDELMFIDYWDELLFKYVLLNKNLKIIENIEYGETAKLIKVEGSFS